MRTLYRASLVRTLAYPPTGEWILVDGRHVQRVGSGEPPEADRVVDLPGTTILPGLIDTHVHLTGTGEHHRAPEVASATSPAGLLTALKAVAAKASGPVLVHGWDESRWDPPEVPTLAELDSVTDRPLAAVRVDGHLTLANTHALDLSGALDAAEGVERDRDGHPTGALTRVANQQLRLWFQQHLADHDVEELQLGAASLAVSHGVTTIHEMSMPAERGLRDLEILLAHRQRLPLTVIHYVATTDVATVLDLGFRRIGGDLPVDGSIGARTAWVTGGFRDGTESPGGYFGDDELAQFFHDGHLAGLQVGVHAIGDAAIEQVIRTWERIYRSLDSRERRHFRARRHRVEHLEMPSADQIERAAALGLAISIQPTFDAEWGRPGAMYERRLGERRTAEMNPFRTLLDRGLEVGAGSDSPITAIDPMVGIEALEQHHDPTQALARDEAIRAYTIGAARLAHQEDKKGALGPGMHADFAAYETDPMDAASVRGVRPVLTVSLGRDVFAA